MHLNVTFWLPLPCPSNPCQNPPSSIQITFYYSWLPLSLYSGCVTLGWGPFIDFDITHRETQQQIVSWVSHSMQSKSSEKLGDSFITQNLWWHGLYRFLASVWLHKLMHFPLGKYWFSQHYKYSKCWYSSFSTVKITFVNIIIPFIRKVFSDLGNCQAYRSTCELPPDFYNPPRFEFQHWQRFFSWSIELTSIISNDVFVRFPYLNNHS